MEPELNDFVDSIILRNFEVLPADPRVIKHCEGAQYYKGRWWIPVWGCDTLQHLAEDITAKMQPNRKEG